MAKIIPDKIYNSLANIWNKVKGQDKLTNKQIMERANQPVKTVDVRKSLGMIPLSDSGDNNATGSTLPWWIDFYKGDRSPYTLHKWEYYKIVEDELNRSNQSVVGLMDNAEEIAGLTSGITVLESRYRSKRIVEKILNDFHDRTEESFPLKNRIFLTLFYGDNFMQRDIVYINGQWGIRDLLWMPCGTMEVLYDAFGKIQNSECAYRQWRNGVIPTNGDFNNLLGLNVKNLTAKEINRYINDRSKGSKNSNNGYLNADNTVVFPEWQINHIKYGRISGQPYGLSYLHNAIFSGSINRLERGLISLWLMREEIGVMDSHEFNDAVHNDGSIEKYEEKVSKNKRLQKGQVAGKDNIIQGGRVNRLYTDPSTDKIQDLELESDIVLSSGRNSLQLLGANRDANVGVLEMHEQDKSSHCLSIWRELWPQVKLDYDFELALKGIPPGSVKYAMKNAGGFTVKNLIQINKEMREDYTAGSLSLKSKVIAQSAMYEILTGMTPEMELQQIEREKKEREERERLNSLAEVPTQKDKLTNEPNRFNSTIEGDDTSNSVN